MGRDLGGSDRAAQPADRQTDQARVADQQAGLSPAEVGDLLYQPTDPFHRGRLRFRNGHLVQALIRLERKSEGSSDPFGRAVGSRRGAGPHGRNPLPTDGLDRPVDVAIDGQDDACRALQITHVARLRRRRLGG